MKLNRKLSPLLLPFTTMIAKAAAELYVAIVVLIVAGVIIYCLVQLTKEVLPPQPPPSAQPTNTFYGDYKVDNFNSEGGDFQTWGSWNPYSYDNTAIANSNTTDNAFDNMATMPVFNFQYGLDIEGNPVTVYGTNEPDWFANAYQDVENDSNTYAVLIEIPDTGLTLYYSSTNLQDSYNESSFDVMQNGIPENNTNADGDITLVLTNEPETVVIEKSTDLVSWLPVFTNIMYAGSLSNFTDQEDSPEAFYRLKLLSP